jgi:hypothetical protein
MEKVTNQCLVCGKTANDIPLIALQYQDSEHWICPQHLPLLIHKPAELANKLPGLENLEGINHH